MEIRHVPNDDAYRRMTTQELRGAFLLDGLFVPGQISMTYCDADRAIVGGAVPQGAPLHLHATKAEMAAEFFTERREVGVVNIGGNGTIRADGREFPLWAKDMLYIPRGVKTVEFRSAGADHPAQFYFVSYPAHASHPMSCVQYADAEKNSLGSPENANRRTICKYIHPGGAKSCQLVMGLTELERGSVWNTMPPHTHARRSEVYLYLGLDEEAMVVHLMGKPDETRTIVVRDRQAVLSPGWSIHCAAGTRNYTFVWAMGGENQDFADMDGVPMQALR